MSPPLPLSDVAVAVAVKPSRESIPGVNPPGTAYREARLPNSRAIPTPRANPRAAPIAEFSRTRGDEGLAAGRAGCTTAARLTGGGLDGVGLGAAELDGVGLGSAELAELDGVGLGSAELDWAALDRGLGLAGLALAEFDGAGLALAERDGVGLGSAERDGVGLGSAELDGVGLGSAELDGAGLD